MKFKDVSEEFLLCHCNQQEFPHPPHKEELATFELHHYGKR